MRERMGALLRFLFAGEIGPAAQIHRGDLKAQEPSGHPHQEEEPRFRLVVLFSWILAVVLILCILITGILLVTGKDVPAYLPAIITGVIGYFGGAISAYFGIRAA